MHPAWWISEQRRELERVRLTALDIAARVLGERGDLVQALVFAGEAVDVAPFRERRYRRLMRLHLAAGDRAAAAEAGDDYHRTHLLGDVALVRASQDHVDEALRAADQARRIARATANPSAIAWSLYVDGEILADTDPDRAMALLDSSIDLARTVGSTFVLGVALVSASSVRGRHGDPDGALRMFLQVVEHWHAVGNWTQQWTTLRNVVDLFVRLRADTPAAALLGALRAADSAAPLYGTDGQRLAGDARLLHSRLGPQRFSAATSQGEGHDRRRSRRLCLRRTSSGHEDTLLPYLTAASADSPSRPNPVLGRLSPGLCRAASGSVGC